LIWDLKLTRRTLRKMRNKFHAASGIIEYEIENCYIGWSIVAACWN
jgi:hypothetical protein